MTDSINTGAPLSSALSRVKTYCDWASGEALACVMTDAYGRRKVKLRVKELRTENAPEELILDGRGQ